MGLLLRPRPHRDALRAGLARGSVGGGPGDSRDGLVASQAIDYKVAHTTGSESELASEVDRYIIWPGQATAYMLGMIEIGRLRQQAERTLGPRFDIRHFHDRVLEDGAVTLPMLKEKIEWWLMW